MKAKTRTLVFMAVLVAAMLIFGFTPLGYIPMPFASLTLMCIPVIIGTLVLGMRAGFGLSLVFILTSLLQIVIRPSVLTLILLEANPFLCIVSFIIPRLLIAPVTWGVYALLQTRLTRGSMIIASACGSLVNTFVYLSLVQIWFAGALAGTSLTSQVGVTAFIWGIVLTNGLPEALLAAVICPLVSRAVSKSVPHAVPVR